MTHYSPFLLRVSVGLIMAFAHGLPKLQKYDRLATSFPNPLFLGSELSLILVIFAELICSLLLVLGVASRLILIPLIIDMAVAAFIFHSSHPFSKMELSLIFLVCFVCLFISGAGAFRIKLTSLANKFPKLAWWLDA